MSATRVAIAGSTGSIGVQTLDVIAASPNDFAVVALGAASSADALIRQALKWRPRIVAVADVEARRKVATALVGIEVVDDLSLMSEQADVVVNGVVGFAGLPVTLAALRQGKRLALANKESLIAAGPIVQPLRGVGGGVIIPVDSEHCAIHQCLRASSQDLNEVRRLVLTASGGPFRGSSASDLEDVSIAQALQHPTWTMGPKITVDSSTLMNKGLEVIEAHELFGISYDSIDVVIHPQSIIHSMVEFRDGATIAQLSLPDMRLPIAYALGYPHRSQVTIGAIDWSKLHTLNFEVPDTEVFRCLSIAYQVGRIGGTAPAWMSAANEVAVEAFLAGKIAWNQIPVVIEKTLGHHDAAIPTTLEDILDADLSARSFAREALNL
ncbi:MAG: 1-deoxy-D-xylulose-5-phosphate reductoisomerase [Ilumatobacteraceae bacterium]